MASCSSLPVNLGSALGEAVAAGASSGNVVASAPVAIGFPSGDVLATKSSHSLRGNFYVVKVISAASAETKNQAQVIRVSDGTEYWAFVTPTHKTVQSQLAIGSEVFYEPGDSAQSNLDETSYTQDQWRLGRVTSLDSLYKGEVQIDGDYYYIKWTRMANG